MTMSRIVVAAVVLSAADPLFAEAPDPLITYRALTSVEPRCSRPNSDSEIIVCGARRADRWRVPYLGYEIGDPRAETVSGERNRLSAAPKVPCGQGAIIANCGGGVGVAVSTAIGASGGKLRARPLAK